jgi:hypothetical protein
LLILHIGSHKAGSSSIQYFLARNAERLRPFGVIYPQIGRQRWAHHRIKNDLLADPQNMAGWNEVRDLGKAHPDKRIVISSEGLETLKERHIAHLKRHLDGIPTRILVYVRDLASVLPSRYNQLTKMGINIRDFDCFYAHRGPSRGYELASRTELWADVFGWENLRIRSLDSRSLAGGDLIQDLLSVLDVSLDELGGPAAEGLALRNVSLGWKTVEVLRALYSDAKAHVERETDNPKPVKIGSLRKSCIQIMQDLTLDSERSQYLTTEQYKECKSVYSREILKLNDKIFGPKLPLPDNPPIGERPFLPSIERIPADQRAEIGRRLADLLQVEPQSQDEWLPSRGKSKRRVLGLSRKLRKSLVQALVEPGSPATKSHWCQRLGDGFRSLLHLGPLRRRVSNLSGAPRRRPG